MRGRLSRALRLASWTLIVVAIAAAAVMLVPSAMGMQRYVIVGGSMEPSIPQGSLIFSELVPTRTLAKGDVITYSPPGHNKPFTHRIHSIERKHNETVYRTKGDANRSVDPLPVTLRQTTQAKFKYAVPYVGWLFIWLANPTHRFIALGVPVLLIALFNLAAVIKDVRKSRKVQHA